MLLQLSHFSPFIPLHPAHPSSTCILPTQVMSMDHTYMFFGFSISHTILNLPLSILYLQFIPLFFFHLIHGGLFITQQLKVAIKKKKKKEQVLHVLIFFWLGFSFFLLFIVIQLQLSAFSPIPPPHPSPTPLPPPPPPSTLILSMCPL